MSILCPNCRCDNAATTRFCTACGAVLVESLPGGRRRRVLRPWGLRSAPLTESPAMPEIAAAYSASQRAHPQAAHFIPLMLVGAVAVLTVAGVLAYPFASGDRMVSAAHRESSVVTMSEVAAVKESTGAALIHVEPLAPRLPLSSRSGSAIETKPRADDTQPRRPSRATVLSAPAALDIQEREPDPPVSDPPVAQAPAPSLQPLPLVQDAWQPLREALASCARSGGLWQRATCEQAARLAHCDGYWGNFPLCPSGRTEFQ